MRITLCGEPGVPLTCPGREYGSHEYTSDDERSLAETSEPRQPLISEGDQAFYRIGWKPLCGEPGAPLTCPGREYGSYEDTSDDERSLAEISEPQKPTITENEQTFYESGWNPYEMTDLEKSNIKSWLDGGSTTGETYTPPHPLEVLQHMLQVVRERHGDRYNDYLNSYNQNEIESWMMGSLQPKACEVLCSRDYTRER